MDYAFDFSEPKIYNGTVLHDSTLMEPGLFSDLYKTIYTGQFTTSNLNMRHPAIHDSLWYIARQREVITLSGLLFRYNAFHPNALGNGTLQYNNGQLDDVYSNGVWQNPYEEHKAVAISPSIIRYKLTYCSVVLPSSLWLGNMNNDISSIQFDAGDGQGYRNLQFDVPIPLIYADTGWKHWVFRVNLANNQQLYTHAKVHFNNTSNAAGSGGINARGVADRRRTVVATEAFNGAFGVADIVISYRDENDPVIRRPLIVAEGLDPGHILEPEEPEGQNDFNGFVTSVIRSGSNDLRNLISDDPSDYDIIYINWRNGTDWLQRNAFVLEEVIRWVNQNKQNDLITGLRNPNVVLGSSMGGVIARMALGRMERNGQAHETNLYVSLDAPHQGANVPLGYQAAARHATRMYISAGLPFFTTELIIPAIGSFHPIRALMLADQPASRQLLMQRIDINFNQNNSLHQQFMQELRNQWDYPQNIRRIAISNGSECAINQEFMAGSNLLYHHRSTKTRFIGDLLFMAAGIGFGSATGNYLAATPLIIPGSNKFELTLDIRALANGGGNQVYYGNIKLTKKVLWLVPVSINVANRTYNAPTGLLPLDTYPGGFYTVRIDNQPGAASQDWMFSYDNSFFIQRRFAFIHTPSALDIGGGNVTLGHNDYLARYIGANPPAGQLASRFQNFTTAYNQPPVVVNRFHPQTGQLVFQFVSNGNEPHEGFFRRNADWLAAELNRVNPNDPVPRTNCAAFCNSTEITGNPLVCNQRVFTVPLVAGATYTWQPATSPLATFNANNNTLTVTRNGSAKGVVTISVTISFPGCGNTLLQRNIEIGSDLGPVDFGGMPNPVCQQSIFNVYANNNYSNHIWNVQNGIVSSGQGASQAHIHVSALPAGQTTGFLEVALQAFDACNEPLPLVVKTSTVNDCTGGGIESRRRPANDTTAPTTNSYNELRIYPNPANSYVVVELPENYLGGVIRVMTQQGQIVKRQNISNNLTKINLQGLPAGVYFVELIGKDSKTERKRIVVTH